MDWTANPLVALFFACCENEDHCGTVWGMERIHDEKDDLDVLYLASSVKEGHGPFELQICKYDALAPETDGSWTDHAVKILHPFYNSPRILAQSGVFTLHSNPLKALDSYSQVRFREQRLDIAALVRSDVDGTSKSEILRQLDNLSINRRTVYPDLDGLAKGLWETEVLWHGARVEIREPFCEPPRP